MTIQSPVFTFIPRDYQIFAGLDVDKHNIAVTFTDHSRLMQSLCVRSQPRREAASAAATR